MPSIGRESCTLSSIPNDTSNLCSSQSIPSATLGDQRQQYDQQFAEPSPPPLLSPHQAPTSNGAIAPSNPMAISDHHPQYNSEQDYYSLFPPSPPPPKEVPLRFLNACNGDYAEAQRRYDATLEWRRKENMDTILREPFPNFFTIKKHYPHYHHGTGFRGEPVYYEFPAKADMKALKRAGLSADQLFRHYNMVTEFQWQMLNRDDSMTSIFIVDFEGITLRDLAGDAVDLAKKASKISAAHYPERAGLVFIVNVPNWFKLIWKMIVPLVPAETLSKIFVLRGRDEVLASLSKYIPMENIPAEYGGASSLPLGQSSEEKLLANLIQYNLHMAATHSGGSWNQKGVTDPVQMEQLSRQFRNWAPARSY
ncbi:unnamed protein product [Cylindrotheca closterium]|uniref:CRAL-TRIO domain-containing protein n=1 Tax=Cylindrotheca closterium TaxID=2856 RepID=A0AAD2C9X7_9STRA|nr:unnamed protein product [Cylindrotheca closterium]